MYKSSNDLRNGCKWCRLEDGGMKMQFGYFKVNIISDNDILVSFLSKGKIGMDFW